MFQKVIGLFYLFASECSDIGLISKLKILSEEPYICPTEKYITNTRG